MDTNKKQELIYNYFFLNEDLTPSESINIELINGVFNITTTFIDNEISDELIEAEYKINLIDMENITKWEQVKDLI